MAVLVLAVAPMGVGQKQSARGTHRTSVEEAIRKLDNERIQAQIHADATALDRIYAFKHRFMLMRRPLIASTLLIS